MKEQHIFTMSDGHKIFATTHVPKDEPIAHIHILHGMAEHHLRYNDFASMLCEAGYLVSLHDHRGHGGTADHNDGVFGYFGEKDGFERVVKDVQEVLQIVQAQYGTYPFTLFGHSMGSFIARRYTQLYSDTLHNVIYCGTGATTALHAVGHQVANVLAKVQGPQTPSLIMNGLSFGSFNKGIKDVVTAFDWLSSDEKEVKKYIDDPKCGFISTNQFFVDLTDGLMTIAKNKEVAKIRKDLPVLFISGAEDPVGDMGKGVYKVAKQLEQAGIENVVVFLFEGMRHEILNEKNKQHVYDVVLRWLKKNE